MGSGFRTFTAGEVLTASNVQNYLQDQAVMVFSGTAARSSAIGTANFEEGMVSYLTDVDKIQVYTGATWDDVYPPAATNQGLTLLNTTSFSAVASQSLPANTFTSTYSHYKLIFNVTGSGVLWIRGRMRAGSTDATTGYKYQEIYAANASLSASRSTTATEFLDLILTGNGTINGIGFFELSHPQETKPTGLLTHNLAVTATPEFTLRSQVLDNTTSYDSMTFYPTSGTMSGSISVYGFNK